MNRFRKVVELFLAVALFRVTYRQMSAVLVLLAAMMPITVPVPVRAYDLSLPEARTVNETPITSNSAADWHLESILPNLLTVLDDEEKKGTASNSASETEMPDKEKALRSTVVDPRSSTDANAKTANPGDSNEEHNSETEIGETPFEATSLLNRSVATAPAMLNQLPENEQASTYSPQNNLGTPPGQTEPDTSNRAAALPIKHRAGAGNFSFGVPLASLAGRGIDAAVGMTYNSRTWNKSCIQESSPGVCATGMSRFSYDVEESWIAPGFSSGFGYLDSVAVPSGSLYTIVPRGIAESDGTKRQFACTATSGSACVEYRTNDGTFIRITGTKVISNINSYSGVTFKVTYPNGYKVYYAGGAGSGTQRKHYPVMMEDNNGNRIRVTYRDSSSGRIDYITDTINRKIKFYYEDVSDKLVAITIPGMNTNDEIQTVRFYYEDNVTLDSAGKFDGTITAPATIRTLQYVYIPATKTAYKYFYHPNYGMITKIERRVGVSASTTSTSSTGTISGEGAWAATTEYEFPSGSTAIDDAPRYSKRTDDWFGRTGSQAQETLYNAPEPVSGSESTSTITVKDSGFDVATQTVFRPDGMLKETSVTKISTSGNALVSKATYVWNAERQLTRIETTNDAGLIKSSEFVYGAYNNQTKVRECGYAAAGTACTDANALRITETSYEAGSGWTAANLLGLPKSVTTTAGGAIVSKSLIEYDHGGDGTADDSTITPRNDLDESGTHNTFYNPDQPQRTETFCPLDPSTEDLHRDAYGCVTITTPGYSAASAYRGNVTKVTRFSNAALQTDSNANVKNLNYDIAGNLVSATLSCCQLKTIDYGTTFDVTGYAFPVKETKGSAAPQLITEYTYNKNTGLVVESEDENGQPTAYQYEADTLRPKKTIFANGGYVENFYSDKEESAPSFMVPGYARQKTTLEAGKFVESYNYFDARGLGIRSATQTPDGWSVSAVEFDKLGRAVKSYNPFYATTPYVYATTLNSDIPVGTKFTEITGIDALGRTTGVKLQDDTTVSTHFSSTSEIPTNFNKTFVTITDQAGKQRRQIFDALGRLVRVDEPDTNGNLGNVDASLPNQQTSYEYDGNDNLSKVIQSDGTNVQERKFKYDSLSRLTHEKQVEATPTLDIDGVHGTADPNKWTKVLRYNTDGLLYQGIDARGVTSTFDYDGLNRVEEVVYSDGTPKVKYYYDQARTDFYNKGALTKVETIRETTTPAEIFATSAEFDYDDMGRLRKHRQWINGQQYDLEYNYNLAGQLTSQKYPSGKIVTNSYDANGRLSGVSDVQRTYLSGMEYDGKGNSLSQMSLGNGTTEIFTLNDRLQMKEQELKKGSVVLQKYAYGYGHINPTTGDLDPTKNNGQLSTIESYIGSDKKATQKFKYDHIGRLKESAEYRGDNGNLTYKQVFDFDRFGNLYRKALQNPITGQQNPLAYTGIEDTDISKTTNRFSSNTTYDDAGQVTADNKFRQMGFAYDANGRQIKVTSSYAPDAWTVYDAGGNRVATKVNNIWQYMVYDAMGKLVAEYGDVADGFGGVKYVQQDWQGSVRTVTNANGFVVARTDHQAFGGNISYGIGQRSIDQGYDRDPSTRQGYGLTERDEATGQDHTWFRKNENLAGRWTSPDPYNGSMNLGDPQSFNRYAYVQSQPTNFVDPSGLNMAHYVCYDLNTYGRRGDELITLTTTVCHVFGGGGGFSDVGSETISFGGGGGGGGRRVQESPDCLAALRAANKNADSIDRAYQAAEILNRVGQANGIQPKILAAIGVRESGFQDVNQTGGYGRGIFQLDTSQNPRVGAIAHDTEKAATFAAQLIISRLNYHSDGARNYPSGNYTAGIQFAAAIRDYNARHSVTRSRMNTAGVTVGDFDRGTARGNYVTNILNLAEHCFNR